MAVFGLDQYLKVWVLRGAEYSFFHGRVAIAPFYNRGIAFSITLPDILMGLAILIALIFVFWLVFIELQTKRIATGIGSGLVFGGAIGNLADRVRVGAVVDYIHLFQTSVVNLADLSIIVGLGIIVLVLFKKT